MDPFKQFVGSEGCSSSESGWTTYIASPMDEDGSDNDEHGEAAAANTGYYANGGYCSGNYRDIIVGGGGEADSDDSMASDASSGACYSNNHQSKGGKAASFKHGGGKVKKNISQFLSGMKPNSSKDKKKEEKGFRPDRKLPATGSRKCWK